MSAPVTEAHIDLVRYVLDAEWYGSNVEKKFAQLIADSEAQAVAAAVTALTCTHHNDAMRAACPVCLVAALTTERDHWQKIAVSASQEREHNANVAQAMTAERDQLRAERNNLRADLDAIKAILNEEKARAERAEDNLAALEQCHDDNCRGLAKIADDLTAERARLDWVFHNCKVTSDDFTVHDREDLGVAMKEGAK